MSASKLVRWSCVLVGLLAACDSDPEGAAGPSVAVSPEPSVALQFAPTLDGSRTVVAIVTDGVEALGMDATLSWDPDALRYAGQIPVPGTATVVNDSNAVRGELVLTMLDPTDVSARETLFAFEVARGSSSAAIELKVHLLVTARGVVRDAPVGVSSLDAPRLPEGEAVRFGWADWAEVLGPAASITQHGPALVPGQGFIFGDTTLDGVINVLDGLYTANVSVGNTLIAECIVGTDVPSRDCIAANVRPENGPGLGEVGDPCPPGIDTCGAGNRTINVLDALAISQESVGLNQSVVGEATPRSALAPSDSITLSGVLTGSRVLSPDTLYVLSGEVRVGDESGAAGELGIVAGTRLAALPGAMLRVTRNGRLLAEGTQFEPVTFDCFGAASPGCWRGVAIDGNATVNSGAQVSPAIFGRTAGGCLEVAVGAGGFGGCADADSSGVLRFVRVLNAGMGVDAGLALRAVGERTVIEHIYVSSSLGIGVSTAGGTARMKRLRVTAAGSAALEWSLGWRGALQFGVLQAASTGLAAIRGINSTGAPDALPRSAPVLRNVTIVGPRDPANQLAGSGGVLLEAGTDATLRGLLVLAQPLPGSHLLDVNDPPTWARVDAGGIAFDSSVVAGFAQLGALDTDPVTVAGYYSPDAEGQYLADPLRGNRFVMTPARVDSVLRAPWASVPDLRPDPFGSPAALIAACPSPPLGHPFFELAPYCGAVEVPTATTSQIPWFEPAPLVDMTGVPLAPLPGLLVVRVESSLQAPFAGVTIHGGSVTPFGVTGVDGLYRSYTQSGGAAFTLQDLPPGCGSPGFIAYTGPAAGAVFFAVETLAC